MRLHEWHAHSPLLSARELEPYNIYERVEMETTIKSYGGSPEELAAVTARLYFPSASEKVVSVPTQKSDQDERAADQT